MTQRHASDRALDIMLDCVSAYRLTRLVTADVITQVPRRKFVENAYRAADLQRWAQLRPEIESDDWHGAWDEYAEVDPEAPKLATLVTCRWCVGVYAAAGVTLARLITPRQWTWAARMLTAAAAAALLAGLEKD